MDIIVVQVKQGQPKPGKPQVNAQVGWDWSSGLGPDQVIDVLEGVVSRLKQKQGKIVSAKELPKGLAPWPVKENGDQPPTRP